MNKWQKSSHLYAIWVVVQQQDAKTSNFLCFHHSFQVCQKVHVFRHICGQHLLVKVVAIKTLMWKIKQCFTATSIRQGHFLNWGKKITRLTISITILRSDCLCFLLRFWKMSQLSSCKSLNPTARWWFSSTDESLYIRASSESESKKRQKILQTALETTFLHRHVD